MAEKTATFSINLGGDAKQVAPEIAAELEAVRSKIEQSQVALKGMSGALRSLKGASEEVTAAKASLKAQIDSERGAVSQANLALLKQGTTYEQLTAQVRKNTAEAKKADAKKQADDLRRIAEGTHKMADGFKYAGGPLADLNEKLGKFRELASGAGGGMALLAAGVGIVVLGVAALTAATISAAEKLGKFIITGANALRSMNLMREAASGSAENAAALGTQVDRLSRIVPTAKDKINELAVSMTRDLSGGLSRFTGPEIVAGIEAVTVATAAMGDQVGGTLRGLVERGKNFGRFWLTPQDLKDTGLEFTEVAESLAKRLHVSLDKAQQALSTGSAGMAAGIGALKDAAHVRFDPVNTEKLLDFDVQMDKLHEHLVGLTKGVSMEPMLKGLAKLLSKFDETTVTGQSLKLIFTKIGDAIGNFATDHIEDLVHGVETVVLWGLKAVEMFGYFTQALDDTGVGAIAVTGLKVSLGIVAGLVGAVGAVLFGVALTVGLVWKGFEKIGEYAFQAFDFVSNIKWGELGKSIIDGLLSGITNTAGKLVDGIKGLGSKIKHAFTDALGISSPSKVFAEYGRMTAAGYNEGIESGASSVQSSVTAMVPSAPAGGASLGGRQGPTIGSVTVQINLPEGMSRATAAEAAQAATSPSVLAQITRAIREGLITQGIPTQQVPV